MANYLNDSDLSYEIIISKGKGVLTRKASKFLVLIGDGMIRKMSIFITIKIKMKRMIVYNTVYWLC